MMHCGAKRVVSDELLSPFFISFLLKFVIINAVHRFLSCVLFYFWLGCYRVKKLIHFDG